ncbi:4-hydroxy-tetrahydrodipicolinate synthase [candidate division WOR-3 bacterium RBG_13_43_14]|uniref:4-hydroxy-tetrahydrodipicolinate synthase n=1 Tax=candidate division WOR-3 bacterium RBG_13_43_14 TaxID=1802590 RepID=A0A1F4U2I9_UNCW3|nr:MAG: 4-hydroxy-tetrahydrodipicolinate synthase [candidate division WOR-3 bacterium RBG_13_43_14]
MYKGSYPAIVTPFKSDKIDEQGFRKNIKFLLVNGSSGIVACATTGESPSLTNDEFESVIKAAVDETKNKVPVIAGAGTNSTTKTIDLVKKAEKCGAQGVLVVTPYYNKPTQDGLYQHYREISLSTKLPIIIYNVPSRTGCNILPKTVARLATDHKNIVAIKEASGNLDQVSELQMLLGNDFDILSGDDSLTFPMMAIGAKGVISVVANILPKQIADMCRACLEQNFEQARQIHLKVFPVIKALFIETNPIPVKKAMELMGLPAGKPRLPLVEMTKENTVLLRKQLVQFGIDL